MFRDPTAQELRELAVGLATFADLGLDPATLSDTDRERFAAALTRTALVPTEEVRFTQRSISPATSDGVRIRDLVDRMRTDGWRGGPVHGVRWGDGSLTSLDNRRLRAARDAGLESVPFVVHSPSDRLADWPHEWTPERQQRNALGVEIRQLPDGTWTVGGDEGRVVHARGTVPQTYGEIALFRAAEQRSLLPGHLFGADREPVLLAKPPDPLRAVELSEEEQRVLDDLRLRATAAADRVQADLAAIGQAVTADLGLSETITPRGQENRVKSGESLARKYADEARSDGMSAVEFAEQVNDVLRFSLVMPGGADFRPALERLFAELGSRGYAVDPESVKNFWNAGNRFHGFNCTVTAPDGQVFELQLPTELSWRAGKLTHEAYEIVRRDGELPPRRVHAFLQMLAINKRLAMAGAIPPDLGSTVAAKDASFAKWILQKGTVWREYRAWLDLNGRGFAEVIAEFGLVAADFPISTKVAAKLGETDVRLLLDLSEPRADDPEGAFRVGKRGGDALGSPGEGVGLRPGASRAFPAQPGQHRPVRGGGPGDGGAGGTADHRRREAPGRGDDQLDLRVARHPAADRRIAERHSLPSIPGRGLSARDNEPGDDRAAELDAVASGDLPPLELNDSLREILNNSEVTPAGRAFYEPHDVEMRAAARCVPPEHGRYTIDMHGDQQAVYVGRERISADDLGLMVKHDPNWPGEPLRLFACETGQAEEGFAQQLADYLGVEVSAPTELAWSEYDGTTYVASVGGVDVDGNPLPTDPPDGSWRVFHPRAHGTEETS